MTSNPLPQGVRSPWMQALACSAVLVLLIYLQLRPQPSVAKIQPESLMPAAARLKLDQAKLPLSFEANQGQFAAPVKFAARGRDYQIALTPQETVFMLNGQPCSIATDTQPKDVPCLPLPATEVRLRFAQANPNPDLRGETELPGKVNYFIGNDSRQWHVGLPTFEKIRARNVYPGVDAVFYSNQRQFEYDLVVAPNADPAEIKLTFAGAQSLRLDSRGDLLLATPSGEMRQRAPVIYQDVNGQRHIIAGHYVQTSDGEVGFALGEYDRQLPLVIDPVLVYSTYLGGRFNETVRGLSVDATGSYVFGDTQTYDLPGAAPLAINRGIYKTTDSAANWNASNTGLNSSSIGSIAFAPSDPAIVYAGGSFKSTDGGNTWSTPTNMGLPSTNYQALAVDPTSAATVYVGARFPSGSNSGVFKTTDGGLTWSAASTGLPASPQITRLAIVTSSPATLYAALASGGVYKSTNGGGNWSAANTGLPNASLDALVIDQNNPSILYVGGGNNGATGVFKSTNGGASWSAITTGMGAQIVFALAIDPVSSNTLYAGTLSAGIFKTTNGGTNWSAVNTGLTTAGRLFTSIVINPVTPTIVYASAATNTPMGTTASAGVYKTTNGGTNWSAANAGTFSNEVATLALNPANPATLLAGGVSSTVLFVSKLNPAGSALLYTTYLGGAGPNGSSAGGNFTTDASGNAYLTGQTFASTFPTTAGAFQITKSGVGSNIVCKLNSAGGLAYSTYLDGNNSSAALSGFGGIAVDGTGKIYVTGATRSAVFPTTPGAFQTTKGDANTSSGDAFLAKLNPAGAGAADLLYSTYLGGNGNETGFDLAVDATGVAYLTGSTASTNFPVTASAFQPTNSGGTCGSSTCTDVFVTKLNPGGNGTADLLYSTYLGGAGGSDAAAGIALGANNSVFISGSATTNFPATPGAFQTVSGGLTDAFVAKLTLNLSGAASLSYSTFLGGSGFDGAGRIAVDANGNAYVAGATGSTNFPLLSPLQATLNGPFDAIVSVLNATGSTLRFSTYLGGNGTDSAFDLAVLDASQVYLLGTTSSADFPTVAPLQMLQGGSDVFVAKLNPTCLEIAPTTLPAGRVAQAYSQMLNATGGTAPYTFSVIAGALPSGLNLSVGGLLSGTPTTSGTFNFTVQVNEANGCIGERAYALLINPPCPTLSVNPATLPNSGVGVPYNQTFTATGGTAPYTFSVLIGALPDGLTLDATTGALTGAPTTNATFSFTIQASDANNCMGQRAYTVIISPPATITVNSTTDVVANDGACTLREAILNANGNNQAGSTDCAAGVGRDTIAFNLVGAGPFTFAPTAALPFITDPIIIDGTTQAGANCTTAGGLKIELNGANAGSTSSGLGLIGGNSVVRGLVINRFAGDGIITVVNGNNVFSCNYIGTDMTGTVDLGNGVQGINITTSNNVIGGTAPGERNLISGNNGNGVRIVNLGTTIPSGNLIVGNFIGTDSTGMVALGNTGDGLRVDGGAHNNTIGGTSVAARNLISGNNGSGIVLGTGTNNNLVQGNYVGTNAAGTAALGNAFVGVSVLLASNNTIGGTTAGAGNVISGNGFATGSFEGIRLEGNGTTGNVIQGNLISLNAAGAAAIPNVGVGILLVDFGTGGPTNTLIGGTVAGARNVISGNGRSGIVFTGAAVANNTVQGNLIGTDSNGATSVGNAGDGVQITAGAHDNLIGGTTAAAGNVIAFNVQRGVTISTAAALGNRVLSNSIFSNGALGIDLGGNGITANDTGDSDAGPNNLQNFPVLTVAASNSANTALTGTLNSVANATFTVQFFANATCDSSGNGEGQTFLGQTSVTTDANGNASFNATVAVPVAIGAFITATATDAANNTSEFSTCRIVTCPAIAIAPTNSVLPSGNAGQPYNQTFTQTGGGAVNFTISAGALPAGLNLSAGGVLSGTPTVFGNFSFTVRATDGNGCPGERPYILTINPPCTTITVNPATLPNGFVGTAYNQTISATGGTGPYTFAVTTGSLPNGLTLNATSGVLGGTPNAQNTFSFTVTATDANGCTGTRAYNLIISGTGLQFFALPSPVRLLDTRPGASPNACSQPNAPIAGSTSHTQPGRNFCGIPANAQALTGNVTTVNSGGGYLTLYPSGAAQPTVASTNYGVNEIVNNVFTVGLGAGDGAFNIFAQMTTDVVVDVTGYYAPPATGGLYFHPLLSPVRLLETRAGQPVGCVKPGTPLVGGADSLQTATTACTGIPAAARSVVGNATTVGPLGPGYLTLYPADVANAPLVASSNYNTNQIVNGPFTAGLSANGQFKIFTSQTTDLVVDVLGYYSTEAVDANGAGLLFTPLARPVRLLETRNNPAFPGCFKPNAPLNGQQVYTQPARGLCDGLTIPATALGVVGNATVVFPVGIGYLTLWPSSTAQPTVATSNYNTNEVINRHFIVGLGQADGAFKLFSAATTDLVIDLSGYFAP